MEIRRDDSARPSRGIGIGAGAPAPKAAALTPDTSPAAPLESSAPDATADGASAPPAPAASEPTAPSAAPTAESSTTSETIPPKPEEPKEGKLLADIRAREAKLVTQRQAFGREQEQLTRDRAALDRDRQQLQGYQQERQLAASDPVRYLREVHKFDDRTIASRLLNGGRPGADEVTGKLEREVEELRKQREDDLRQQSAREHQQRVDAELAKFENEARGGADKWPLAAKLSQARLHAHGLRLAQLSHSEGRPLTNAEILDRLEEELTEYADLRGKQPAAPATPAPKNKGTPGHESPPSAGSVATSGQNGSTKSVLKMTPEELKAYTLAELKRKREAGQIRR